MPDVIRDPDSDLGAFTEHSYDKCRLWTEISFVNF